ncbi:MAG: hypothetical protein H6741_27785 [Alphaproteobacteria bacterium]|nr:hypothetical protein [Alphaproteobacteria bacterium]
MSSDPDDLLTNRPGAMLGVFIPVSESEAEELFGDDADDYRDLDDHDEFDDYDDLDDLDD